MTEEEAKEKFTPTVGVVVLKDNRVLLVRHTEKAKQPTGVYGFPAGRVEEGESEKQAAVRELEEETGLTASVDALFDVAGNHFKGPLPLKERIEYFTFNALVCTSFEGKIRPSLDGKTIPEWIDIKNLPSQILPNIPVAIRNAIQFLNQLQKS